MAQFKNLIKNIRSYPYYYYKEDKSLKEEFINKFILTLQLGEVFIISRFDRWETIVEKCKQYDLEIDKYEFTIKSLKLYSAAIVIKKGDEVFAMKPNEVQIFNPNSLFEE